MPWSNASSIKAHVRCAGNSFPTTICVTGGRKAIEGGRGSSNGCPEVPGMSIVAGLWFDDVYWWIVLPLNRGGTCAMQYKKE